MSLSRTPSELSAREKIIENTILLYVDADLENPDNISTDDLRITSELMSFIKSTDDGTLLKLAIANPVIDRICQAPAFQQLWEDLWRQCGANPNETSHGPQHENLPIPTLSCFSLLKGFYLYQQYLDVAAENEILSDEQLRAASDYLKISAQHGCFFALNALCAQELKLCANHPDSQLAEEIINYAKRAAALHWTPGYLLLSNVYHELSAASDSETVKHLLFNETLTALAIAQKLEPYSQAMINNAYQGKTLYEASGGIVKSWFQAKIRLVNFSNGLLQNTDIEMANRRATIEHNNIVKAYRLNEKPAPIMDDAEFENLPMDKCI